MVFSPTIKKQKTFIDQGVCKRFFRKGTVIKPSQVEDAGEGQKL